MISGIIKRCIASIGYWSGILNLICHLRYRKKAAVFMYHRIINSEIASENAVQASMYVTPHSFERHIVILKNKFNIVPLSELIMRVKAKKNIGGYCSITFDDGWLDNYKNVYPVILKHNVPIVIFLATGFIGTEKWFWPEEVSRHLLCLLRNQKEYLLPSCIRKYIESLSAKARNTNTIIDEVIVFLKSFDPVQRMSLVKEICSLIRLPLNGRNRLLLNWSEVRDMAESGLVEFGAHTVNHVLLNQLDEIDIFNEIFFSKQRIESEIGASCKLFSYPNGHVNVLVKKTIEKIDFDGAVVTKRSSFGNNTELMAIPRIGLHEDVSFTIPLLLWRIAVK